MCSYMLHGHAWVWCVHVGHTTGEQSPAMVKVHAHGPGSHLHLVTLDSEWYEDGAWIIRMCIVGWWWRVGPGSHHVLPLP